MMNRARFPTRDVQLSHADKPGLPSGAPSIDTPLKTPLDGGRIVDATMARRSEG
jgi:hypothetical protein